LRGNLIQENGENFIDAYLKGTIGSLYIGCGKTVEMNTLGSAS
jgi:hypothetical protein